MESFISTNDGTGKGKHIWCLESNDTADHFKKELGASMSVVLAALEKAWTEHVLIENQRGIPEPHAYIYASARRHCKRRMYLECTQPASFPEFDADTKARLARGNQRERDISIDLMRVGRLCRPSFEFIGQQERVAIVDRKGRQIIRGKIDGFIKFESGVSWPAEIKSWSPFLSDRIFTFEDLFRNYWTTSGAYQLLSYLYEKNAAYGLLILDRLGLPRLIEVSLEANISAMEEFLQDAEIVVDAIEANEPPAYSPDPNDCKRCPAFSVFCNPPISFPGASIVTDEDTIARTERYAELQAMPELEEFEALDKWKKERFRGVEQAIVGKTLVTGKPRKTTTTVWPDDATKKKYQVSDLNGAWVTTVTKVSE